MTRLWSLTIAATPAFALAAAVSCGAGTPSPAEPQTGDSCGRSMIWGGWEGEPRCREIARARIPAADLACRNDEECVLVGEHSCGANSVALSAHSRWRDHPAACGHPAAGDCAPTSFFAECRDGCCNVGARP